MLPIDKNKMFYDQNRPKFKRENKLKGIILKARPTTKEKLNF